MCVEYEVHVKCMRARIFMYKVWNMCEMRVCTRKRARTQPLHIHSTYTRMYATHQHSTNIFHALHIFHTSHINTHTCTLHTFHILYILYTHTLHISHILQTHHIRTYTRTHTMCKIQPSNLLVVHIELCKCRQYRQKIGFNCL